MRHSRKRPDHPHSPSAFQLYRRRLDGGIRERPCEPPWNCRKRRRLNDVGEWKHGHLLVFKGVDVGLVGGDIANLIWSPKSVLRPRAMDVAGYVDGAGNRVDLQGFAVTVRRVGFGLPVPSRCTEAACHAVPGGTLRALSSNVSAIAAPAMRMTAPSAAIAANAST